jgi:hypothetical protein
VEAEDHHYYNVSSWYAVNAGAGPHLTAAGFYYAFISLTIFRFIMCRWYFRLFVWYRFLWQVRALPLHLNLYHPDGAGGLGFLSGSLPAFAPVFAAQTAVLSAFIFSRILYAGQKLPAFKGGHRSGADFLHLRDRIPFGILLPSTG